VLVFETNTTLVAFCKLLTCSCFHKYVFYLYQDFIQEFLDKALTVQEQFPNGNDNLQTSSEFFDEYDYEISLFVLIPVNWCCWLSINHHVSMLSYFRMISYFYILDALVPATSSKFADDIVLIAWFLVGISRLCSVHYDLRAESCQQHSWMPASVSQHFGFSFSFLPWTLLTTAANMLNIIPKNENVLVYAGLFTWCSCFHDEKWQSLLDIPRPWLAWLVFCTQSNYQWM